METIDMLWNVNCNEQTKYIIVIALIVICSILCMLLGKKTDKQNKNNNDE